MSNHQFRGESSTGHGRKEWAKAKAALGEGPLMEALTRVERCDGCPRLILAAAVHHFLCQDPNGREALIHSYLASLAHPLSETLPLEEASQLDRGFRLALHNIFGDQANYQGLP